MKVGDHDLLFYLSLIELRQRICIEDGDREGRVPDPAVQDQFHRTAGLAAINVITGFLF